MESEKFLKEFLQYLESQQFTLVNTTETIKVYEKFDKRLGDCKLEKRYIVSPKFQMIKCELSILLGSTIYSQSFQYTIEHILSRKNNSISQICSELEQDCFLSILRDNSLNNPQLV